MERQKRNGRVGLVRPAFTLVELLVVITIIGMLMALLMPAIQAARAQGQLAQCKNNQKELGLAMLSYESSHKGFPGWRNYVTTPPTGSVVASWLTMLLPNLERTDLWQNIKTANGVNSGVSLKVLICPSDPPDSVTGLGPSAYVANGLVLRDQYLYNIYLQNPTKAANLPYKDLAPQTLDFVSGADGTTNTLMLGENTRLLNGAVWKAHNWYFDATDPATSTWLPPSSPLATSVQFKQTFGFPITNPNPSKPAYPPALVSFALPYGLQAGYPTNQMTANINSSHGGGAVVTFFDGHGQFLRDEVGLMTSPTTPSVPATGSLTVSIYQILVTPDGSKNGSLTNEPPADEGQWQ